MTDAWLMRPQYAQESVECGLEPQLSARCVWWFPVLTAGELAVCAAAPCLLLPPPGGAAHARQHADTPQESSNR